MPWSTKHRLNGDHVPSFIPAEAHVIRSLRHAHSVPDAAAAATEYRTVALGRFDAIESMMGCSFTPVRRCPGGRSKALVRLEPIGTTAIRAAKAAGSVCRDLTGGRRLAAFRNGALDALWIFRWCVPRLAGVAWQPGVPDGPYRLERASVRDRGTRDRPRLECRRVRPAHHLRSADRAAAQPGRLSAHPPRHNRDCGHCVTLGRLGCRFAAFAPVAPGQARRCREHASALNHRQRAYAAPSVRPCPAQPRVHAGQGVIGTTLTR